MYIKCVAIEVSLYVEIAKNNNKYQGNFLEKYHWHSNI